MLNLELPVDTLNKQLIKTKEKIVSFKPTQRLDSQVQMTPSGAILRLSVITVV